MSNTGQYHSLCCTLVNIAILLVTERPAATGSYPETIEMLRSRPQLIAQNGQKGLGQTADLTAIGSCLSAASNELLDT